MKIARVRSNYILICRNYLGTPDRADVIHAATCLQTNAALITNDRHFDRIRAEGISRVMNITEALKVLDGRTWRGKRDVHQGRSTG